MKTLNVRHSTALPIREVSALTTRSGKKGPELLAVGDEDFAIISAALNDERQPAETRRYDLCPVLPSEYLDSEAGSGFEGIASDTEGTIFVLQEEESRILVFSPEVEELLGTIRLTVPEQQPGFGVDWNDEANTNERGEGLLLLKRGHVLVAKQTPPLYLIEFGPTDHSPHGIRAETVLPSDAAFDRPAQNTEFVPLASWPLGKNTEKTLPTLNDIAVGQDQRVYVLSSKGHTIARLEQRLTPAEERLKMGEAAHATDEWKIVDELPGQTDSKPEGLTMVDVSTPTIGIDSKVAGDNVMLLSRL